MSIGFENYIMTHNCNGTYVSISLLLFNSLSQSLEQDVIYRRYVTFSSLYMHVPSSVTI